LLLQDRRPQILLVGDLMLDEYIWGDVDRISPEAPIPILRVQQRETRLGGAGSVAAMLQALDAEVQLVGVVGDDDEARQIRDHLERMKLPGDAILAARERRTIVKQRLLGRTQSRHLQQMIRVDSEQAEPIGSLLAEALLRSAQMHLDRVDLVLLSDYNKGVCAGQFVAELVALARAAGKPVIADPARDVSYDRYAGCTCLTPNRVEAREALGRRIESPDDGLEAARKILNFGVEAAVVTLDRDGIAWADTSGHSGHFAVRPRQVFDITGAGDMVLAALGYALASGSDYPTAIELANLSGGLEVERLGVVPLSRSELLSDLSGGRFHTEARTASKVVTLDQLQVRLQQRRQAGQRIVMTNGCFDLLHPGHLASLEMARAQGDCLVVGLNSDQSVASLKGPGRPIVAQQGRAEMLAALACVDYVLVFDDTSVERLVGELLPDVLVKSSEYTVDQVVGSQTVQSQGGRVVLVPMKSDYSTSALIERVRNLSPEPDKPAVRT
jgi:D-beta-D-heptose 7-phosphate kinase/D-beta-D-heptose 1-phosphate adenosyltransferase